MIDSQARINDLITYLRQMRLPVMADHLRDLYTDKSFHQRTTLDILEILINEEYQSRRYHTIQRNIKNAQLTQVTARLENIDYSESRQLNPELFEQLSTCQFIENHRNIIIQGATGTGKSFIANALCLNAIESGYTAYYIRMIELLSEMYLAELENQLPKLYKKLSKVDVLVIDDFLLTSTTESEQKYLMEVFELRNRDKMIILASQMSTAEWHKKLGSGAIADAILDRAINNSYHIFVSGDSMRRDSSKN